VSDGSLTPAARSELAACVTRWTGFHADAVSSRALDAAARPLLQSGLSVGEVVARAQRDDPDLRHRLTQAVPVGESFFFRHPEHFAFIRRTLAPRWAAEPERRRSIWSAGCAGGEEAYSLAAVLRACGVGAFEIVGTDLVEANIETARAGRYGPWSLRAGVPRGEDPFLPSAGDGISEVDPALRACTRFQVHDVLGGPPAPGRFDLVFCRNVLIYFTPEAASRALASLASALAAGGTIAFATMDLAEAPAPLVRVGAPEVQLFERPPADAPAPAPTASPPARPITPSPRAVRAPRPRPKPPAAAATRPPAAPEPVSLHLGALAHIERGDHARARAVLRELQRLAPGYLPGMLEGALLHAREGRRADAAALMRSVLQRARALPAEQPIAGPETLPASFYAATAQAFLGAEVRR